MVQKYLIEQFETFHNFAFFWGKSSGKCRAIDFRGILDK